MPRPRALIVIPARYGSTRFPGKPLASINGTPMILHVVRRASKIINADRIIVATDDDRIARVVEEDGHSAVMTSRRHRSGTSRVAEVAEKHTHGIVVNIQGDEPLLPVRSVERLIGLMKENRSTVMGTIAARSDDPKLLASRDVVKVVCSLDGRALYFSRSPVPSTEGSFLHHTGIYAYRRPFLLRYGELRKGPLEKREGLEQLRALENGFDIAVVTGSEKSMGVDRPADIKRVEKELENS